jgi:hypothetical protein
MMRPSAFAAMVAFRLADSFSLCCLFIRAFTARIPTFAAFETAAAKSSSSSTSSSVLANISMA